MDASNRAFDEASPPTAPIQYSSTEALNFDRQEVEQAGKRKPQGNVTVFCDGVNLKYKVHVKRRLNAGPARLFGHSHRSYLALRGVSLAVREGEFVGLVGRNGSGKSSLLRVLAGVEPPSSGIVLTSAEPQLLGVNAALLPEISGHDNITLGLLALGMTPKQVEAKRDEVAELTQLGDALHLPMRAYSSGMGARLRFAISVAADPEILMIDEALATGDAAFMERSRRAMSSMLERAGTVFLVSHAAQTIEELCTRAIWLDGGQIIADGPAVDVARAYRWYAHNLAEGNTEKAAGLLVEAVHDFPNPYRLMN